MLECLKDLSASEPSPTRTRGRTGVMAKRADRRPRTQKGDEKVELAESIRWRKVRKIVTGILPRQGSGADSIRHRTFPRP